MSELTMRRGIRRHAILWITALAALVGATVGAAVPARALGVGDIDPSHAVSLTVHKYEQPAAGNLGANDGHELANPGGNPIDGVTFEVQKVTSIDLSTSAGWTTTNGLTAAQVLADPTTYPLGTAVSGVTANGGVATFSNLSGGIGIYLVRETAGPSNIAAPAIPFLVTLPQPDGNGVWNYDVHVYPKNAINAVTKTVNDSAAHVLGDTVTWTVTANVPRLPQGTTYTRYILRDTLDSRLTYSTARLALRDGATTTPLVKDTDYEVINNVEFEFLAPGLVKLNAASPAAQVVAAVDTVVNAQGDGTITNLATVFTNDSQGTDSPPVDTYWGSIKITKIAQDDVSKTLAGAEFDVYAVDPATPGATPVKHLTTDSGGVVSQTLKAAATGSVSYWLVETEAPAGYQLVTTPIRVDVVKGDVANPVLVTVKDPQVSGFELPMTGGGGTRAYTVGGIVLVLFAIGGYLLNQRRRARR